jgi:hypothetical protein
LPEFRLFASFWGCMLAIDVGKAAGGSRWVPTLIVGVVVGACSLGQRAWTAVLMAAIGWLFVLGFVLNEGGELALSGAADLHTLIVLLAGALLASVAKRHRDATFTPSARVGAGGRRTSKAEARVDGAGAKAPGDR